MRVVLIPTGQMERRALGKSLEPLFPGVTFEVAPPEGSSDFLLPKSFTSASLPFKASSRAEQNIDKLASRLAAEVEPGRRGRSKPALVVLVEDLELANTTQPAVVCDALRQAIKRHTDGLRVRHPDIDPALVDAALKERASFHLMAPMTEAYFFGDPLALAVATPRACDARLRAGCDVENFEAVDSEYLSTCSAAADCKYHPKKYMQFLCRAPHGMGFGDYKETREGAAALETLDWRLVLKDPKAAPFARALIEDIADAVGQVSPISGNGSVVATSLNSKQGSVLRNI